MECLLSMWLTMYSFLLDLQKFHEKRIYLIEYNIKGKTSINLIARLFKSYQVLSEVQASGECRFQESLGLL